MSKASLSASTREAIREAERGNTLTALMQLENDSEADQGPLRDSYLAFCLAKEQKRFAEALELCKKAMEQDPKETTHYLNLGRVYLLAGHKKNAISIFRKGLKQGKDPRVIQELKKLGLRGEPVIASLDRENPVNVLLGKLFSRLGLR